MLGICFCFREQSHIPCSVIYCSCPFGEKEFATLCLSVELMCWPFVSPQERIFFKDTLMQVGALSWWGNQELSPPQVHYCWMTITLSLKYFSQNTQDNHNWKAMQMTRIWGGILGQILGYDTQSVSNNTSKSSELSIITNRNNTLYHNQFVSYYSMCEYLS
jgi:hypothetical protein